MQSLVSEVRSSSIDIGADYEIENLHFLKQVLENKQYIFLGESSHTVKEYSEAKVNIIKYLHKELGFNVLAFESELGDCFIGNYLSADLDPLKYMSGSIGRVWQNEYLLRLFKYMKETEKLNPLHLSGIDVQQSDGKHFSPFLQSYLTKTVREMFIKFDRLANEEPSQINILKRRKEFRRKITELENIGNELIKEIEKQSFPTKIMHKVVVQTIKNRLNYSTANLSKGFSKLFEFRDELMAKNLEFLSKEVYPGEKFIIWAHNFHVRKKTTASRLSPYKSIVENLPLTMKEKSFVLGLYAKEGKMGDYKGDDYSIKKPNQKHLEWLLNHSAYENFYIPCEREWAHQKWRVFEGGNLPISFVPAEQYDGLLFFKKVQPAHFLS